MQYSPSNAVLERVRRLFQRRVKDGTYAVLGNGGTPNVVEVPDRMGYVYARFPDGRDASGFALYSAPFMVRCSDVAYPNYAGAGIYVAIGYSGDMEIVSAHYPDMDSAGIDTRTLNPLHQQAKWVYPWQLTIGLVGAVATSVTASTKVMVKQFRYYLSNVFQMFETPLEADKIDLAAFIPTIDEHCYACVWIDTYTNTAVVTASVAQSMFTPLDATDIQELVADRPPDAMPLKAIYLSNAQATITQNVLDVDLRQFLSLPELWGFPNPVDHQERIRPKRNVTIQTTLTITSSLENLGELSVL